MRSGTANLPRRTKLRNTHGLLCHSYAGRKKAFDQLKPEDRKSFIEVNRVTSILVSAEEHGTTVPEIDYLPSGVYNPKMHLDGNENKAHILGRKLDNAVIRNMIDKVCGAQ